MKVWTKSDILHAINTKYNRHTFIRVLAVLIERQTSDEQDTKKTRHLNKKGFNTCDAKYLTTAYNNAKENGGSMSKDEFIKSVGLVQKYWRQLMEEANARETNKTSQAA